MDSLYQHKQLSYMNLLQRIMINLPGLVNNIKWYNAKQDDQKMIGSCIIHITNLSPCAHMSLIAYVQCGIGFLRFSHKRAHSSPLGGT